MTKMEQILSAAARTGEPPSLNYVTIEQKVDALWVLLSIICEMSQLRDPNLQRVYEAAKAVMATPAEKR